MWLQFWKKYFLLFVNLVSSIVLLSEKKHSLNTISVFLVISNFVFSKKHWKNLWIDIFLKFTFVNIQFEKSLLSIII